MGTLRIYGNRCPLGPIVFSQGIELNSIYFAPNGRMNGIRLNLLVAHRFLFHRYRDLGTEITMSKKPYDVHHW